MDDLLILSDQQLESLVWVSPHRGLFDVKVGEMTVYQTYQPESAQQMVKWLMDGMMLGLKRKIARLAKAQCFLCRTKSLPRKLQTEAGLRIYHHTKQMGWQPCDADHIWLALIRDTYTRKENRQ